MDTISWLDLRIIKSVFLETHSGRCISIINFGNAQIEYIWHYFRISICSGGGWSGRLISEELARGQPAAATAVECAEKVTRCLATLSKPKLCWR